MKVSIIGYKNHAKRLESILNDMGIIPYMWNHHTDNFTNLIGSDAILISSPNDTHVEYIKKMPVQKIMFSMNYSLRDSKTKESCET